MYKSPRSEGEFISNLTSLTTNGNCLFYLRSHLHAVRSAKAPQFWCLFLANDVTLVTSYGYCQSLKINDIRDTSVLRSVRRGGYSVRRWVRVCTGTMKPLPYQRHIPLQFILWENARALKCFASASFDQQELFNFFLAINKNYLMLLRMHCFVYFRSGRILFVM